MLALILASVIANGFIILRFSPTQFYKLHRYDGQLLYIKATFIGVLSTVVSFVLDSYLNIVDIICQLLPKDRLAMLFKSEHLQEILVFCVFSALISVLYCILERFKLFIKAVKLFKGIKNKPPYS